MRVQAGEWFWNGRRLTLQWWSPLTGTELARQKSKRSEHKWVKAFGIPLHAWSLDTFKTIGDLCGGFIGIDEDTKHRSHHYWARICVNISDCKCPEKIELDVEHWRYEFSDLKDVTATPKPILVFKLAGEEDAGCSSVKRTVGTSSLGVEEPVYSKHVGRQVAAEHF